VNTVNNSSAGNRYRAFFILGFSLYKRKNSNRFYLFDEMSTKKVFFNLN